MSVIQKLTVDAAEHRRWHEENQRSSFASQGLALLDPDRPADCPFCARTTLDDQRVETLRSQADHPSGPAPTDPRAAFKDAIATLRSAGPLGVDALPALVASLPDTPEAAQLAAARQEQNALDTLRDRVVRLSDGAVAAYETASRPNGDPSALEGLVGELAPAVAEVAQRHAALRAELDVINLSLTQRFSGLGETEQNRMAASRRPCCWLRTDRLWKLRGAFGGTRSN